MSSKTRSGKIRSQLKKKEDSHPDSFTAAERWMAFMLPVLLLWLSYQVFGSFYETNDDPRYTLAMKGVATPKPFDSFLSVYIFTVDIYIWLYRHFPGTAWYGWSMFFLLWGALVNVFLIFCCFLRRQASLWVIVLGFIAFYFLFFFQNEYWMNFTRPALLATGTSLFLIYALINSETVDYRKEKHIVAFASIIFTGGHFTRLDAGYLAGFFCVGVLVIIFFKGFRGISFKRLFPFIPIICIVLIGKVADLKRLSRIDKDFLEISRLSKEYDNYQNTSSFTPKNIKDSLAFDAAARALYCSDKKVINADFFRKITGEGVLKQGVNWRKVDESTAVLRASFAGDCATFTCLGIFLLLMLFCAAGKLKDFLLVAIRFVALHVFLLSLLWSMIVFMKLPARIYNPLLVLYSLGCFMFFMQFRLQSSFQQRKWIALLGTLALLFFFLPKYLKANNKNITDYARFGKINNAMIANMNGSFKNTIFIPTSIPAWEIHFATDPLKEMNMLNGNCYVYLTIELSVAPETYQQLIAKFGTDDHAKLFRRISEMDNVVFISDDNYNNFLSAYYHFLYGQDYRLEPVRPYPAPLYKNNGLSYYRVRKMEAVPVTAQ